MLILRVFIPLSLIFMFSLAPVAAKTFEEAKDKPKTENVSEKETGAKISETRTQQQLVESVDIQGNRRLKDVDLLYYIKTREGDVYDQAQLERDLKELLSLNFFDKTYTRVLTEEGVRGGVKVIFQVRELLIIRDLQF